MAVQFVPILMTMGRGSFSPRLARRSVVTQNWAEFIRIQCQFVKLTEEERSLRSRLLKRQDELLERHRAEWLGTWPESIQLSEFEERGFVASVHADRRHPYSRLSKRCLLGVLSLTLKVTAGDANKLLMELAHLEQLQTLEPLGYRT